MGTEAPSKQRGFSIISMDLACFPQATRSVPKPKPCRKPKHSLTPTQNPNPKPNRGPQFAFYLGASVPGGLSSWDQYTILYAI